MATMAEISTAINQIDTKKQTLHELFLHLQSHSPFSSDFPLNWSDLDSHFKTLQSSLKSKFNLLQTLSSQPDPTTPPARPELITFCENSDGLGLNRYIALSPNQQSILSELPDAYRFAPDVSSMVLDAMAAFYGFRRKGFELGLFRNACLIMLEGLMRVKKDVSTELKEKAMEIAVNWNQKRISSHCEQKVLGFLLLIGAYGVVDRFNIDDLIDCFIMVADKPESIDLCRRIIPANKINDMIQKLKEKDMHVTAVKFSIDLEKTDEFPPVALLEDRKLRSLMVIDGRNADDFHAWKSVTMTEISRLKSIIECIDENHLESVYPKDSVVELVNKLQNELENSKQALGLRKQPPRATVLKQQMLSKSKKSKKPKVNKVQPTAAQSDKLIQETNSQQSGPSPDHVNECHNSSLGSGQIGSKVPSASLVGSPQGSTRVDFGYDFYVPRLQLPPPSDCNSNGWISD